MDVCTTARWPAAPQLVQTRGKKGLGKSLSVWKGKVLRRLLATAVAKKTMAFPPSSAHPHPRSVQTPPPPFFFFCVYSREALKKQHCTTLTNTHVLLLFFFLPFFCFSEHTKLSEKKGVFGNGEIVTPRICSSTCPQEDRTAPYFWGGGNV